MLRSCKIHFIFADLKIGKSQNTMILSSNRDLLSIIFKFVNWP